jgi:hypothetical protein
MRTLEKPWSDKSPMCERAAHGAQKAHLLEKLSAFCLK